MASGILENAGGGSGTVEYYESWDRIRGNPTRPGERIELNLTNAGILDLSDELRADLDFNGDGILDSYGVSLEAQEGGNTLTAGAGNDRLVGGTGDDRLHGGAGDDRLLDESGGSNLLVGGAGNDHLLAVWGENTLRGGDGDDRLEARSGSGLLEGGAGRDALHLYAGRGTSLYGGAGDDTLFAQQSTFDMDGGAGNDIVRIGSNEASTIRGGLGQDRLVVVDDPSGSPSSLNHHVISGIETLVNRSRYSVEATGAQLEAFVRIQRNPDRPGEKVALFVWEDGTPGDTEVLDLSDELKADRDFTGDGLFDSYSAILAVRGGDNLIRMGSGNDELHGSDGSDSFYGGAGNDILRDLSGGTNLLAGGAGNDRLLAEADGGTLFGGDGDDSLEQLYGGLLAGGAGNDAIRLITGYDSTLLGGDGDDLLFASDSSFRMEGGAGNDTLQVSSFSSGTLSGGTGQDRLVLADLIGTTSLGDFTMAGIETLEARTFWGGDVGATTAQLKSFDRIRSGQGWSEQVPLRLESAGSIDLSDELGPQSTRIWAHRDGNAISTSSGNDSLFGDLGADRLSGRKGDDDLFGLGGDDILGGADGRDDLHGDVGRDTLWGGDGDDWLTGGDGADRMSGGQGSDDFIFNYATDSGPLATARDSIHGFTRGRDDIDVSAIDARTDIFFSNETFGLDSDGSFSAGEIRQTVISGDLLIEFNTDFDQAAEMSIRLVDVGRALASTDFIL